MRKFLAFILVLFIFSGVPQAVFATGWELANRATCPKVDKSLKPDEN